MNLLDYLKPLLKEESNIKEVEDKVKEALTLNPDQVKEWIALPENKSIFDFVAQKAVSSHIEKEKTERDVWETKRSAELLEEAKSKIAKDNQKSPEMIQLEEIQLERKNEKAENELLKRKNTLLSLVDNEKMIIPNVDPFVSYGEDAETKLREFTTKNSELIESAVKKIIAEKFGKGSMGNEDPPGGDDKPVSTADYLKSSGFQN